MSILKKSISRLLKFLCLVFVLLEKWLIRSFVIFKKLFEPKKKKNKTPYNILELPENAKYHQIRSAYKVLLFKYKPNLEKDTSNEMREVMEAYNTLKNDEMVYLDHDWFTNENLLNNFSEALSNLEKRAITVTEHNIKSKLVKYKSKYPKLIAIVRRRYVKKVLSQNISVIDRPIVVTKKKEKKILDPKKYACRICKKEYNQITKYEEHLKTNKHIAKCQELGIDTGKPERDSNDHIKKKKKKNRSQNKPVKETVQKKEEQSLRVSEPRCFLTCTYCGQSFKNRGELTLHLQQH